MRLKIFDKSKAVTCDEGSKFERLLQQLIMENGEELDEGKLLSITIDY